MELRDGIFAVKLCELEHQYGLLRSRLELCQGADHERVRRLLGEVPGGGPGEWPAAGAERGERPAPRRRRSWRRPQRDYVRRVESILREKLPPPPAGRGAPEGGAGRGGGSLRGVRHRAGQAVRGALAAALTAMDQEMDCEEEREEEPV